MMNARAQISIRVSASLFVARLIERLSDGKSTVLLGSLEAQCCASGC